MEPIVDDGVESIRGVASASHDRTVRLWTLDGKERMQLFGELFQAVLSSRGDHEVVSPGGESSRQGLADTR